MKKVINYIILITLIGVTTWVLINNNDLAKLPELIKDTNKNYLALAFLGMVLFWICDAYIINKMKKVLNIEDNFFQSLKSTMIGQYYSSITPFASGGEPAQIYSLVYKGVSGGTAISLFINKFLIYQLIVTFYCIFMFIFKFEFLYKETKLALSFVITGCVLNFLGLLIIIGLFLNEQLIKGIFNKLFKIGYKIKLVKDIEKAEENLDNSLKDYMESINIIKNNKKATLKLALATVLQLTFYFSITYFVYLSVGLRKVSYFNIVALQSLHYMAVSFMPTPGTVGASEGGFYMLFNTIFPKYTLAYAIILWRIIDYYFRLILSGVVTLIDYIYRKIKKASIQ
jgi:uncharacterized protein (TIRG00374 family)